MQPQFYMYCYPWDLEDEGLEESIGRLAGEIGVDGINVAATTSEVLHYRPRKPLEKRVFKTEAGAHFQPDKKFYSSCRIKPHPAAWMKSRNALERIVKVCEKEKLKVRASINCCVGRALVERYPFAACVNALGVISERVLCPTHPDVREFLAAMVEDLSTNYGLEALEIRELRWEDVTDHNENEVCRPPWLPVAADLLSHCFCSSCRQAVSAQSVGGDAVLQAATARLEEWLDHSGTENTKDRSTLLYDPDVLEYSMSMRGFVLELVSELKQRAKCELAVRYSARVFPADADFIQEHLMERIDAVVVSSRMLGDGATESTLDSHVSLIPSKLDVIKSVEQTDTSTMQALVASTLALAERGYRSISFSDYGRAHQHTLDAIRQAIRFARRETR
ncbi:MAG: hypothetical protein HZA51_01620 [Planctomycetes bacterium]|nr:hypothetical protein [Planctomycetota bacterium]